MTQGTPRELIAEATASLPPLMKARGYRKYGNNFVKHVGENASILGIVSSSFNGAQQASFGIEVGVYLPEVTSRFIKRGEKNRKLVSKITTVNHSTWTIDIGFLTERKRQKWWEVKFAQRPADANVEVVTTVESVGLPWLERNVVLTNFLDWLTSQIGYGPAETLYMFDRRKEAYECLRLLPTRPNRSWGQHEQAQLDEWYRAHPLNDS